MLALAVGIGERMYLTMRCPRPNVETSKKVEMGVGEMGKVEWHHVGKKFHVMKQGSAFSRPGTECILGRGQN